MAALHCLPGQAEDPPPPVAEPVLELFASRCTDCHGRDAQESGLRLDRPSAIREGGNTGPLVTPGDPAASRLIRIVRGTDPDIMRMPPEDVDDPLDEDDIRAIEAWIAAGAPLPEAPAGEPDGDSASDISAHWAFQPVPEVRLPPVTRIGWTRNAVDHFVLAHLERQGIEPSPEADRSTLLRRVTLDLTGVPPTPEELRTFLEDKRPDAYERQVDRLLASPRYGERWGRHWLDLARYADSDGYTNDVARVMWKYRDWVIDAWNRDDGFDQFVVEQFAGDLLPQPTDQQLVATGFHRNTQRNREGGSDPEQYRVEAVVDRVATTGTVFLGLTLGCARCHDHKFDPVTQREFYELFAFLNSQDEPEHGLPRRPGDEALVEAAASEERRHRATLEAWDREFDSRWPQIEAARRDRLASWTAVVAEQASASGAATLERQGDGSLLATGDSPGEETYVLEFHSPIDVAGLRLEVLTDERLPGGGPGRAANGNFVLHELEIRQLAANDVPLELTTAAADHAQERFPIEHAIDGDPETGWAINVSAGQGDLHHPRAAEFLLSRRIPAGTSLQMTIRQLDDRYHLGRFRVLVSSDVAEPLSTPTMPVAVREAWATPRDERTDEQTAVVLEWERNQDPDRHELARLHQQSRTAWERARQQYLTTTLILRERAAPRETRVHLRGDFLRPGRTVEPGVPACLPPLPEPDDRPNRLDLARWLVADHQPLTPRVTVNRTWQRLFGHGLVRTENDFGTRGERPTHPALLDWLARDLVRHEWSMKHLHRRIVLSATYRQSSFARPGIAERDPENRWLSRQNRLRLEAEPIRDAALQAAGILSYRMHGPGVYPPQPDGVMRMTRNPNRRWIVSEGENRYRRGLYTYFWRSTPYPFLKLFNAPESNTSCTRRERSHTPVQVLTLLNDEVFFEAAHAMAFRVLALPEEASDVSRIERLFVWALARKPQPEEITVMLELLAAERVATEVPSPPTFPATAALGRHPEPRELAAWTTVCRTILNVDEFITRE